jgi:hypothetical protein
MDQEDKNLKNLQALGDTFGGFEKPVAWKDEAVKRLGQGESEETVLLWLLEQVRTVITDDLERVMGFDQWFATWLLEWAREGVPGPLFPEALGGVRTFSLPDDDGDTTPLVIAMAGPMSDPEALAKEFLEECRRVFPEETWVKKEDPARDARWFRLFREKMSDRQIAELEVADKYPYDLRAVSEKNWEEEVQSWEGRICTARCRWWQHITRKAGLV